MYVIESLGHGALPDALASAGEADVEDVVRAAARHLGWPDVTVERVAGAIGCIATVDVVASASGTPIVVARPAVFY